MKILHIVAGELNEGAARGSYWLHQGLISLGVDSHILTSSKETFGDHSVTSTVSNVKERFFRLLRGHLDNSVSKIYPKRTKNMFSTGFFGYDVTKSEIYKAADIVHLHWICDGFINVKDLYKVKKPIIWTMRDMWPMTGGCHYALDCVNYKTGCGNCIQLGSDCRYDLSWLILKRKEKCFSRNIKLVGISNWLSEQAKASQIFKGFSVRTIYNNVDTCEFRPVEKSVARSLLSVPSTKKIILVGAGNNNSYKGFNKFIEALDYIHPEEYFLCFFGCLDSSVFSNLKFEYKNLGFLHDNVTLRLAYSCADVFVAPSLMEAFGKTIVESMACGTPAVCFDATGPSDIITHKVDGYKATPFEPKSLAKGIIWVLNHPDYGKLCENSRDKITQKFDSKIIAEQYIDLYRELLDSLHQPSVRN